MVSTNMAVEPSKRSARSFNKAFTTLRENGLPLVLLVLFLLTAAGQIGFGLGAYNTERLEDGRGAVTLARYRIETPPRAFRGRRGPEAAPNGPRCTVAGATGRVGISGVCGRSRSRS